MKISKLKALWALVTGGWSGLAVYLLDAVNEWLATLDSAHLARAAEIVNAVASAVKILAEHFLPEKYRVAANNTLGALTDATVALGDARITDDELDAVTESVKNAVAAWKAVG